MAAGQIILFSENKRYINPEALLGVTVKVLLAGSGYTPNVAIAGHSVLADVTNEIANGNGYVTGGATLASLAVASIAGGWKFSSANVGWTASGGSIPAFRNAIFYVSGSLWGKTNPLLGHMLGDATNIDYPATASGLPLTINCPAGDGWIKFV